MTRSAHPERRPLVLWFLVKPNRHVARKAAVSAALSLGREEGRALDQQQKLKGPQCRPAGRTSLPAQVSHRNVTSKLAHASLCCFTRAFLAELPPPALNPSGGDPDRTVTCAFPEGGEKVWSQQAQTGRGQVHGLGLQGDSQKPSILSAVLLQATWRVSMMTWTVLRSGVDLRKLNTVITVPSSSALLI